ncbi:hypothetical protein P2318_04745 [Myxococcaceae bacterium GXIMD 01537]
MRAIIVGALVVASGALVSGCSQPQGRSAQQAAQSRAGQPAASSAAPGAGAAQQPAGQTQLVNARPAAEEGTSGPNAESDPLPPSRDEVTEGGQNNSDDLMDERQQGIGGSGVTPDQQPAGGEEFEVGVGEAGVRVEPPEPQGEALVLPPLPDIPGGEKEPQSGTGGSGPGTTARENPVVGQVQAHGQGTLMVRDADQDLYALAIDSKTCISRGGKTISASQLDTGDTVRARWRMSNGARVATWVELLKHPGQPAKQGTGGSGLEDGESLGK